MNAGKPESCTTWSRRKRHLSLDLAASQWRGEGRVGRTLCGDQAYDVQAFDLGVLPECARCAKSAARRAGATS